MSNENKLIENPELVKDNFEHEEKIKVIREEILKKFEDYRKTVNYMAADAPIGVLVLPEVIHNLLTENGCRRIYDLFDCDFTKIKGFGVVRIRYLTARLDEFFSML